MITIGCCVIVIAGTLVELLGLQHPRQRAHRRAQLIPIVLMVAVIALVVSPVIGLVTGIAALVMVITNTTHTSERLAFALSEAWPMVLDETATRIASLGDALPIAFFSAAKALPKPLDIAVDEGAKSYQLTGDFKTSLGPLLARLTPGTSTETVRMLASLASASAGEVQAALSLLAERHRADHNLTMELQAKLSGARLARAFVVVVPVFLLLIGVVIGGGMAPYLTRLGLTMATIAIVVIALCWLWADHYLTPLDQPTPKRLYQSRIFQLMNWFAP